MRVSVDVDVFDVFNVFTSFQFFVLQMIVWICACTVSLRDGFLITHQCKSAVYKNLSCEHPSLLNRLISKFIQSHMNVRDVKYRGVAMQGVQCTRVHRCGEGGGR